MDFLVKYAKFIIGDWDRIYGIENKDDFLNTEKFGYEFIKRKTKIFFRCTDGIFWEVYAKDKTIIDIIMKEFPHSEMFNLEQEDWV